MNNFYQKGSALYISLIILSVILAIVLGLSAILIGQIRTLRNVSDIVTAYHAAETGWEYIYFKINKEGNVSNISDIVNSLNDYREDLSNELFYRIKVLNINDSLCRGAYRYCVKIFGYYKGANAVLLDKL
jgi:hypothetical protein